MSKDNNKFWDVWRQVHGAASNDVTRIGGFVSDKEIAQNFVNDFQKIY